MMLNIKVIVMLFIISLITVPTYSKPLNGMTRIQQVLRTLMGSKQHLHQMHARGKKLFPDKLPVIEAMEDYPVLRYPYEDFNNDRIYQRFVL
uniref:Uncharacterized protein n=1 Tax=Panagrolaimus sp. PS1159 TaxID=55785 RepID=A0AC35GFY1_9BILA